MPPKLDRLVRFLRFLKLGRFEAIPGRTWVLTVRHNQLVHHLVQEDPFLVGDAADIPNSPFAESVNSVLVVAVVVAGACSDGRF